MHPDRVVGVVVGRGRGRGWLSKVWVAGGGGGVVVGGGGGWWRCAWVVGVGSWRWCGEARRHGVGLAEWEWWCDAGRIVGGGLVGWKGR